MASLPGPSARPYSPPRSPLLREDPRLTDVAILPSRAFATLPRRIAAGFIDGVILLIGVALIEGLVTAASPGALAEAGPVLSNAAGVGYWIYFHGSQGQTPGKMVARVRVISTDGTALDYAQATWRQALPIASVLPILHAQLTQSAFFAPIVIAANVLILADVLVAFVHPQRRALHDLIARSMVVRLDVVRLAPHAPLPDPHGPDAGSTGATREP